MAAIETHYDSTASVSLTPSYVSCAKILGSGLVGNARYFVHAHFHGEGDLESKLTVGGIDETGTEMQTDSNNHNTQSYITVIDTAASPQDIELLCKSAGSVDVNEIQLFAMLLTDDLVEGQDYVYEEDITSTNVTSTYATRVLINITPSQSSDWLVFLNTSKDHNGTSENNSRVILDGAASGDSTLPDCADVTGFGIPGQLNTIRYYPNLSAGNHTIECQIRSTGTIRAHTRSALFALNLGAFKEHAGGFSGLGSTNSTIALHELADISITPSVTSDILAFGYFSANGADNLCTPIIQLASTTEPVGWDSRNGRGFDNISTEGSPNLMFSRWTAQSASAKTIKFYVDQKAAVSGEARVVSAAAFTLELSPNDRFISGTVTEKGQKVIRKVIVYRRSSPFEVLGEATSAADGSYTINGLPAVECMVVVQDDEAGTDYNDVITARVIPASL